MAIKTSLKIKKGRFDFVPLLSVIFLLLIFIMFSSSFVQVSAIQINLPDAGAMRTNTEKLVISIDKDSNFYFNDQEMGFNKLKEKLGQMVTVSKIKSIILRADKDTTHGVVTKILALAVKMKLNVYFAVASSTENSEVGFESYQQ